MKEHVIGICAALTLCTGSLHPASAQTRAPRQSGTLGLQFACSRCDVVTDWAVGTRTFHFSEAPVVIDVTVQGPAVAAGVQAGDTITHIDGVSLITDEGGRRFANIEAGSRVLLTVHRDGQVLGLPVTARPRGEIGAGSARIEEAYARILGRAADALAKADSLWARVGGAIDQPAYTGTFAGVDVRVDGPGPVSVTVVEDCLLSIRIGEQTITLRRTPPCSAR